MRSARVLGVIGFGVCAVAVIVAMALKPNKQTQSNRFMVNPQKLALTISA